MIHSRRLVLEMAVLAATILLFAAVGPFGSYAAPLGERMARWALYLIVGYACFRPVIAAGRALTSQSGLPVTVAISAACMFGAFPTSMLIAFGSLNPEPQGVSGATLAATYLQTLIIGATVTAVQLLARREAQSVPVGCDQQPAMPADDPGPARASGMDGEKAGETAYAPLLSLLPPHLRSEILYLENEDHYVRVHTRHGSAMVLMRMRDAAVQLQEQGERVHRGWWVARDAVAFTVRENRNWKLRLVDGRDIPVARANVASLRAKGWLTDATPGEVL